MRRQSSHHSRAGGRSELISGCPCFIFYIFDTFYSFIYYYKAIRNYEFIRIYKINTNDYISRYS